MDNDIINNVLTINIVNKSTYYVPKYTSTVTPYIITESDDSAVTVTEDPSATTTQNVERKKRSLQTTSPYHLEVAVDVESDIDSSGDSFEEKIDRKKRSEIDDDLEDLSEQEVVLTKLEIKNGSLCCAGNESNTDLCHGTCP